MQWYSVDESSPHGTEYLGRSTHFARSGMDVMNVNVRHKQLAETGAAFELSKSNSHLVVCIGSVGETELGLLFVVFMEKRERIWISHIDYNCTHAGLNLSIGLFASAPKEQLYFISFRYKSLNHTTARTQCRESESRSKPSESGR